MQINTTIKPPNGELLNNSIWRGNIQAFECGMCKNLNTFEQLTTLKENPYPDPYGVAIYKCTNLKCSSPIIKGDISYFI